MRIHLPLSLILAAPVLAAPPASAAAVAMVADIQGEARRGDDPRPLAITLEIGPGVPLRLKAGSTLTLLLYASGDEVRLTGPGTFTLDAKGSVKGPAAGVRRAKGPGLDLKAALKPGGLAQASMVMRGASDFDVEPAQPTVLTTRPVFRWAPIQGAAAYRFRLRQVGGPDLHTLTTPECILTLPAGLQLQPGTKYQWTLTAELPGIRTLHSEGTLEVLEDARRKALQDLHARSRRSFTHHLLYASVLQEYGLEAEARVEWRALSRQRPEDPMLKALAR